MMRAQSEAANARNREMVTAKEADERVRKAGAVVVNRAV